MNLINRILSFLSYRHPILSIIILTISIIVPLNKYVLINSIQSILYHFLFTTFFYITTKIIGINKDTVYLELKENKLKFILLFLTSIIGIYYIYINIYQIFYRILFKGEIPNIIFITDIVAKAPLK